MVSWGDMNKIFKKLLNTSVFNSVPHINSLCIQLSAYALLRKFCHLLILPYSPKEWKRCERR